VEPALLKVRQIIDSHGQWFRQLDLALLFFLTLFAVGVWGFIKLTGEVFEGDTQAIDDAIVLFFRQTDNIGVPIGPPWLQEMGRDATALGGLGWISIAIAGIAGFLFLARKPHLAVFLVLSTVSGLVLSMILKASFARPRPELVPHLSIVYTSSFPSGHSMLSAVTYLTLGTLVATVLSRPILKAYVIFVAVLLTLIVGVSRVYLGVHYPTDVIAGWIAGLIWAMLCGVIAKRLQYLGKVENDLEPRR